MDRLKKRVEAFRKQWQGFINRNWNTVPDGDDNFRSLDALWIIGAIRFERTTTTQRICWKAYHFSVMCSYGFLILCLLEYLFWQFDLLQAIWYSAAFVSMGTCLLKHLILIQNFRAIQQARNYINSKPCDSGDKQHDLMSRKKLFQRIQATMLVFLALLILGQVIVSLPNSGWEQYYGTPKIVTRLLGPKLTGGIRFLLLTTLVPEWLGKYFLAPLLICFLLLGYANELEIFIRGFENVLDHVQLDVQENLPPQAEASTSADSDAAASKLREAQREELFWKYLNKRISDHIKQHVELLENMQLLEPAVRMLFFVAYYNSIVITSCIILEIVIDGLTGGTAVLGATAIGFLLECFCWCRTVEVLNDLNEKFHLNVMNFMVEIPHTKDHHKEYVEMRMTLSIVMANIRNSCQFSCGGVFEISLEVIVNLLDIGYSLLTFLLNFR